MTVLNKLTDNSSLAEKFKFLLKAIRSTTDDRILGILRLLLGGLFVMTGLYEAFCADARRGFFRPATGSKYSLLYI